MKLAFMDSPITRAELAHRQQPARKSRGFIRGVIFLSLVVALYLFLGTLVLALIRRDVRSLVEIWTFPALFLGIVTLAVYVGTLLRALIIASETIAREKQARTWEILLLSGLDGGQIVRGKWWATVRLVWPSFLVSGMLRLGVVTWVGMFIALDYARTPPVYPDPLMMLLCAALVVALGLVSAGLAAACGILASLISHRTGTGLAVIIYAAAVIAVLIILGLGTLFFNRRHYLAASVYANDYAALSWQFENVLSSAGFSVIDQGSILAATLLQYQPPYAAQTYYYAMNSLVGGVLALMIDAVLIWLVLRIAQSLAVRQGALPHDNSIG